MLELINWIKDGKYRIKILEALYYHPYLSSELASTLNVNRASVSRILKDIKDKELIEYIASGSRTRTYKITEKGRLVLEEYWRIIK